MALTAEIVKQTLSGIDDQRLQLAGGAYTRKLVIENNWTKIRLGLVISSCRKSAWGSPPKWYFGLTSGTSAPPGSAVPNHFFGSVNDSAWIYNSFSDRTISSDTISNRVSRIQAGVETMLDASSAYYVYCADNDQLRRALYLDIEKGSPNYTLKLWGCWPNTADMNPSTFYDYLVVESLPTTSGLFRLCLNGTYAVDEATYGVLDTVCFSWLGDTAGNAFEISDIIPYRFF